MFGLGPSASHHKEAPRNRLCLKNSFKGSPFAMSFYYTVALCTQYMPFHAFPMDKKKNLFLRGLIMVNHFSPQPSTSKHIKPGLSQNYCPGLVTKEVV